MEKESIIKSLLEQQQNQQVDAQRATVIELGKVLIGVKNISQLKRNI